MIATPEIITELRELLDEEIPAGGSEADTAFLDSRLITILDAAPNLHAAAAEGWRRKAAKIQKHIGSLSSYKTGDEQYEYVNLTTALNAAMSMVKMYDDMGNRPLAGGYMLRVEPPEVL